ncbi:hypothetical protein ACFL6K_01410 [Candidatus Latescibacterota bacterium]
MKVSKFTVFCIAVSLVFLFAGSAFAQDDAVTVDSILKKAEAPLTEEQTKTIKSITVDGGFEGMMTLNEMFTEKQTAALKEVLGVQQGFGGGGEETPANLMFVVLFANEGCPFTEGQIKKINALDSDDMMGRWEAMQALYTEKQSAVMQEMMSNIQM